MRFPLFFWLCLTVPALADCAERSAVVSFWIMLPGALIYAPAYGLRLAERRPCAIASVPLGILTVLLAWSGYAGATWFAARVLELGLECGGIGILVGHVMGAVPPWAAHRLFPKPHIAVAE